MKLSVFGVVIMTSISLAGSALAGTIRSSDPKDPWIIKISATKGERIRYQLCDKATWSKCTPIGAEAGYQPEALAAHAGVQGPLSAERLPGLSASEEA